MKTKQIIALAFGIIVVLLIASTGAFTEIIEGFANVMGFYGLIAGVFLVLIIVIAVWQAVRGGMR